MSAGDLVSMGLVYLSMLLSMPRCCYLGIDEALFWSSMEAQSAVPLVIAAGLKIHRKIISLIFKSAVVSLHDPFTHHHRTYRHTYSTDPSLCTPKHIMTHILTSMARIQKDVPHRANT